MFNLKCFKNCLIFFSGFVVKLSFTPVSIQLTGYEFVSHLDHCMRNLLYQVIWKAGVEEGGGTARANDRLMVLAKIKDKDNVAEFLKSGCAFCTLRVSGRNPEPEGKDNVADILEPGCGFCGLRVTCRSCSSRQSRAATKRPALRSCVQGL